MLNRRSLLALVGAAALGPTPALAADGSKRGGTLRVVLGREIVGIDPQGPSSGVDRNVYTSVYNGLVTVDQQLRIVPDLAVSWTQPDARSYVFKLRKGVQFHDGTKFDAAAVKFNFDYILDAKNNSQRRPEMAAVERIDVIDPLTVKISLKAPFAPFLAIIADRAGYMVSPAAREKYGKDLARNPVGTGPFRFVEWQRDDHLKLRRFENYHEAGLPYLDEVIYRPIVDQSVALTELRTGNVDFLYTLAIDPKDIPSVRRISNLRVLQAPGVGFEGFWINTISGPMANRDLREAFSLGIDRDALIAIAYSGIGRIANGPISPSSWAYDSHVAIPKRDIAAAKKKLAEGGKPSGFSITLKSENSPLQAKIAQLVQSQLREIGIDLRLQALDFGSLLRAGEKTDFDVLSLGWSGRIDPDGNIEPIFESKGAFNYGKYHNPEVDAQLEKARQVLGQTERKKIYAKVVQLIENDAAYAFTYFTPTLFLSSAAVHSFALSADALMRFKTTSLTR